jgi:predicted aconitase with swiveling domain
MRRSGGHVEFEGDVLASGHAAAPSLVLDEALSFWGGVDPETAVITDTHHPQVGASLTGRIIVLPGGRGSSSSSSVLAETIRNGTGPAGLILGSRDPILAVGAVVARELYGRAMPVIAVDLETYSACRQAQSITIDANDERATVRIV